MDFKRFLAVPAGAAALVVAQGTMAMEVPGPVVDPQWLNDNLEQVTVLQIAGSKKAFAMAPKYETVEGKKVVSVVSGHVPGARFVEWGKVRVERMENGKKVGKLIPEKNDFESFVQALGVNKDDSVVIVPLGLSGSDYTQATRLYWQMKYFGHDDMALLDGGLANWLAAGFDAGTGQPEKVEAGDWEATDERDEILATYAEAREAVDSDGKIQLLDARPLRQYLGVFSKSKTVPGHLPGAKNVPTGVLVRADGAAANFLPESSYRSILEFQGVEPTGAAVAYCNSGNLASGIWFVASEIMGNENVSLYDGSMKEYGMYVDDGATSVNPAQLY
ncbi:MAG: sulfurtransferase [Guyparkeria sp.]